MLLISGEIENEPLIIRALLPDGRTIEHTDRITFHRDSQLGTLKAPFILGDEGVAIDWVPSADIRVSISTVSGILIYEGPAQQFDNQRLTTGEVFIIKEQTPDGRQRTFKWRKPRR